MAETFFVKCLKPTTDLETFDDLHHLAAFTSNALKMDFEISCTCGKCAGCPCRVCSWDKNYAASTVNAREVIVTKT